MLLLMEPQRAFNGADGGTRTPNLLFTKQVLNQLSYASILSHRSSASSEIETLALWLATSSQDQT